MSEEDAKIEESELELTVPYVPYVLWDLNFYIFLKIEESELELTIP